ncbi:MAG: flagellar FlbD family protein [Myxococcales bacterium]|nr:flagellar FlbD family protein [Myxococcales bacterium]
MIHLTRLGHHDFVLNSELILTVESTPDTVVTLMNGVKYMVEEPVDEVVRRVIAYRRAVHAGPAAGE